MRLVSQFIRSLLALLLIAIFGMGGAGAAPGDCSRGGYPVSEHSLSVQSLDLAFTARAPPTSGRNLTFAGAAFVQAGSMHALDGVEASGVVYAHLRSPIAPGTIPNVTSFADELGVSAQAARRHLRRAVPGEGGQAHHILAWEARSHDLVQRAVRGGFNINGANNGIRLQTTQHLGSHPRYNAAVQSKLDSILRGNPNISDIDTARAV